MVWVYVTLITLGRRTLNQVPKANNMRRRVGEELLAMEVITHQDQVIL